MNLVRKCFHAYRDDGHCKGGKRDLAACRTVPHSKNSLLSALLAETMEISLALGY